MPPKRKKEKEITPDPSDDEQKIEDSKPLRQKVSNTKDNLIDKLLGMIPIDILRIITSHFSKQDLSNCYCVNKCWNRIFRSAAMRLKILSNIPKKYSKNFFLTFPNLQDLDLAHCVDDLRKEDLETLATIPSLIKLQLYWHAMFDTSAIAKMTNLEHLSINVANLSNTTSLPLLPHLSSFKFVNKIPSDPIRLSISNSHLPNAKFNFRCVPKLVNLELYGFSFANSLDSLTQLTKLTSFVANGTFERAKSVINLSHFCNLRNFICKGSQFRPKNTAFRAQLVDFLSFEVAPEVLEMNLPTSIETLELRDSVNVVNYLPNLQYLTLSGILKTNLQPLSAAHTLIWSSDEGQCLTVLTNLTRLVQDSVNISCALPTSLQVAELAAPSIEIELPWLRTLTVKGSLVSDQYLLLTSVKNLSLWTWPSALPKIKNLTQLQTLSMRLHEQDPHVLDAFAAEFHLREQQRAKADSGATRLKYWGKNR
jgi:hypothetical protein